LDFTNFGCVSREAHSGVAVLQLAAVALSNEAWVVEAVIIIIIIIATQGRVVYGERRHAEPPGGNDHPQLSQRLG
jgi:hypothetical protein